jgi:lysozyme family protein
MTDTFDKALAIILKHEGGFVNHPRDPGGMTNLGVTRNTLESYLGRKVTEAEMRALKVHDAAPIYRKRYWDAMRCGDYPAGLALCVFDFGVNAGIRRGVRYLQMIAGAAQDGIAGPGTTAAVQSLCGGDRGEAEAIRRYSNARRGYYKQLPTFGTFGKGWIRRVDETETDALRLVR